MSEWTQLNPMDTLASAMASRCEAIGAPLWSVPGDARPMKLVWGPAGLERVCARLGDRIADAARSRPGPPGELTELTPGVWVAWVPGCWRRESGDRFAVLLLAQGAAASPALGELDADERALLRDLCVHTPGSARQSWELLRSISRGLSNDLQAQAEIDAVSARLTEAYEDIGLLHLLGEAVNALTAPERFVQMACDELIAITPSAWALVLLDPMNPIAKCLDSHAVSAGELPLSPPALSQLRAELLPRLAADSPALGRDYELLVRAGIGASALRPIMRDGRVAGAIAVGDKLGPDADITSVDVKRLEATANSIATLLENARLLEDQQAMFMGTLQAMTAAIDAKDPYTRGHSERVAHLAYALSIAAGLDPEAAERNRVSGLVHDVGKIGVRESVLRKSGRLTDAEYDEIKQHPAIGHHILGDIPQFGDLLPGVLHHHERYDGRGYPMGLSGTQIPLQARIIGLVDAFDAMSSTRTYRAALPRERVLQEVRDGAGTQFDPSLAAAFLSVDLGEFDELVNRHRAGARGKAA